MRSLKHILPPPVDQATFAKARDIWRFEIYRTHDQPPVQRVMSNKPRRTDVNEVLWAISERLRPFSYNPPFLKDEDAISDMKRGHYADLVQNGLVFVPRWVPVYIARALQSYLVRKLPMDEAFHRHLGLVSCSDQNFRDAIRCLAEMFSN